MRKITVFLVLLGVLLVPVVSEIGVAPVGGFSHHSTFDMKGNTLFHAPAFAAGVDLQIIDTRNGFSFFWNHYLSFFANAKGSAPPQKKGVMYTGEILMGYTHTAGENWRVGVGIGVGTTLATAPIGVFDEWSYLGVGPSLYVFGAYYFTPLLGIQAGVSNSFVVGSTMTNGVSIMNTAHFVLGLAIKI